MQRRRFVLGTLKQSLLGTAACSLTGCGTLFHSERVGQPHSRDIDWKIVALDGLGLLLFFVPGVIAFIVDFGTGAIYLPPEGMGAYPNSGSLPPASGPRTESQSSNTTANPTSTPQQVGPLSWRDPGLKRVMLPRERLRPRDIEDVVASETGCQISLNDDETRLSELSDIDCYDEQLAHHHRNRNFGHSVQAFFSRFMPT